MNTVWKTIPTHDEYEISDTGEVRRRVPSRCNRYGVGYVIKPFISSNGYKRLYLSKDRVQKKHSVHRLVLLSFVGKPESDNMQAAHNDGNRTNNSIDNLRWATPLSNNRDKIKHGTVPRGEDNKLSTLTEKQVIDIVNCYKTGGITKRDIAKKFGVKETAVYHVLKGRTWGHVTGLKNTTQSLNK